MKKLNRRTRHTSVVDPSPPSSSQSPGIDDKELYEKRLHELEHENDILKREVEELRCKLANASSIPDVSAQNLKEVHVEKMNALEGQVLGLKKKLELQFQFSTQKTKGDEAAKRFQDEIQKLRAQKVHLQCKLKLKAVQFRLCNSSLQKEILQLKKENRRNAYEMHLLLALNLRQKLVLQRKTEEAVMATKRLKDFLESRKALTHRTAGANSGNHSQFQSIERELEVTVEVQKVCSQYECELEEMAGVINKLKLEAEMLKAENSGWLLKENEIDPGVKDSEFNDLKEEVARLSSLLSQMALPNAEVIHQKSQVDPVQTSASGGSSINLLDMDTSESEFSEGVMAATGKTASGVCCFCSKKSLCKTSKCACRASGGSCGISCGCASSKCTNRELGIVETEKSSGLASQDALPQNSHIEKPVEMKEDCGLRKQPLREIRNKLIKSISLKPGHRKSGQKAVSEHNMVDSPC